MDARHTFMVARTSDGIAAAVDFSAGRPTGDREHFEHHPLSAEEVGGLSAALRGELAGLPAYPVYGLLVEVMAYSGLRAAEVSGLEIGDLVFAPGPKCSVWVRRTKKRKGGQWVTGTLKSKRSRRDVPPPGWLATKPGAYLTVTHTPADDPTAPLWPSRKNGGGFCAKGQRYAVPLNWPQPFVMVTFYDTILKPALEAVGLPASHPRRRMHLRYMAFGHTICGTRSRCSSCRLALTLCRYRSGWGTALSRSR